MNGRNSHRRDRSGNGTLPAISEDGDTLEFPVPPAIAPPVTPRALAPQSPLRNSPNSAFSDTSSTAGPSKSDEKPLSGFRNRKEIARRGGWKRLVLVAIVVILCLVGLIVGLVVGLRNNNKNNNQTWSSTTNSALNTTFPAGSWSISTFLSSTSSSCTSNSATWSCYPYITYNQSTTSSLAQFNWIIYAFTSTSSTDPTYTISSTSNPFSIVFSNVTLTVQDAGQQSERYTFGVPMNKPVVPASALTSANIASTCYFNQTIFSASLYTNMSSTYNTSTTEAFQSYPHAVSVTQEAESGSGVPDCVSNADGASVGDFSASASGQTCSCNYMNYGV